MDWLFDIYYLMPPGAWAVLCAGVAALIFLWLRVDMKNRRAREESRSERMARLKQEAIEKLRAEKRKD